MALIKHHHAADIARHAIVLNFADLNRQAEQIIADARIRAQAILDDAQQQAQSLIESAEEVGHGRGYEEGLAEGLEQGLGKGRDEAFDKHARELEVLTESWKNALYHWNLSRNEMFLEAREDILSFAVALAARIVRRLVELDPSLVATQLEDALELLSAPSSLCVVINPEDRSVVERAMAGTTRHIARSRHVLIEEDPSLQRGGCIVRTAGGAVDATIEKQLDRIAEALLPREPSDNAADRSAASSASTADPRGSPGAQDGSAQSSSDDDPEQRSQEKEEPGTEGTDSERP